MSGVLLDRDGELGALDTALGAAAAGRGSVTVISGPVGAGKSALLGETALRAAANGARVLSLAADGAGDGVLHRLAGDLIGQDGAPPLAELAAGRDAGPLAVL